MDLFSSQKEMKEIEGRGRIRFVGQRERFSATCNDDECYRRRNTEKRHVYSVGCLRYGGRAENVAAAKAAAKGGEVTEETLMQNLWTAEMPDPNIIIRTSGEKRLSGFLPWQSIYSELFFTDTKWPAFTKEEFDSILAEFAQRERRRGK